MRYRSLFVVPLCLACVGLGAMLNRPATGQQRTAVAKTAMPDIAANRALSREQLALIDRARDIVHKLYQNGRVEYPSLDIWDRRLLETLRRAGAGKAEIIAALEKHISMLKVEESIAENMWKDARATHDIVLDARYRRMEAEMSLNEEKAR